MAQTGKRTQERAQETSGGGVSITLLGGMRFEAVGEDGVRVALDASAEHHGTGSGFRPLELMLVSVGACTAMDVISILRKKRQDVTAYRVEISGRQATSHPRIFTEIFLRHILHGNELAETAVARSIELSETTYCPAIAMLRQVAHISSTFEVHPAAPPD